MMQAIGRRYVACFNGRYRRTGTLWDGRLKSVLVGCESYALACYRYIELNPVRAGMALHPTDYPWSSYRCNALGALDARIKPHPSYLQLGTSDTDRQHAYRILVAEGLSPQETDALRLHTQQRRQQL